MSCLFFFCPTAIIFIKKIFTGFNMSHPKAEIIRIPLEYHCGVLPISNSNKITFQCYANGVICQFVWSLPVTRTNGLIGNRDVGSRSAVRFPVLLSQPETTVTGESLTKYFYDYFIPFPVFLARKFTCGLLCANLLKK